MDLTFYISCNSWWVCILKKKSPQGAHPSHNIRMSLYPRFTMYVMYVTMYVNRDFWGCLVFLSDYCKYGLARIPPYNSGPLPTSSQPPSLGLPPAAGQPQQPQPASTCSNSNNFSNTLPSPRRRSHLDSKVYHDTSEKSPNNNHGSSASTGDLAQTEHQQGQDGGGSRQNVSFKEHASTNTFMMFSISCTVSREYLCLNRTLCATRCSTSVRSTWTKSSRTCPVCQ